jgi:hypothetical protein
MSLDLKKIAMLAEESRLDLDILKSNVLDASKDRKGRGSSMLSSSLRFLGVADYVLKKDVAAFRTQLTEAAQLRRNLFDRFEAKEPISPSYVSMLAYRELLNALAAGNTHLSKQFAAQLGGRDAIEKDNDLPFDIALGYTLKSLLMSDAAKADRYLQELEATSQTSANIDFKGYVAVLRAILNQDVDAAKNGFVEIIAGHKKQCKGSGLFKDTEDEVLCVWGVGVANLARMHGVVVEINDPLIPSELII